MSTWQDGVMVWWVTRWWGRVVRLCWLTGEVGGVAPRPCESQKMLVMELWLSRAFSSSGSAFGSRTGDRCRFAGLNPGVFLFSTARLLSTGFFWLSTRFLFLGKNVAPNLMGFLSSIFSISVITRRYTLYLFKRKQ